MNMRVRVVAALMAFVLIPAAVQFASATASAAPDWKRCSEPTVTVGGRFEHRLERSRPEVSAAAAPPLNYRCWTIGVVGSARVWVTTGTGTVVGLVRRRMAAMSSAGRPTCVSRSGWRLSSLW